MYSMVTTAIVHGIQCISVSVEADVSEGLPVFDMVGLLGSEVREARERVRTALRNSGFLIPAKRITVNLSPADVRKSGSGFDFPIAVAILSAMGMLNTALLEDVFVAGEVGLNGAILPVEGILPMACEAIKQGKKYLFVAKENEQEASMIGNIQVCGIRHLQQMIPVLSGATVNWTAEKEENFITAEEEEPGLDFAQVRGQEALRRVCEISASGMHHLLISGPPGAGKTMAASRIPGILPELTPEEQLELSKVYSVMGMMKNRQSLIRKRPYRSPHHSITPQGLIGGGRVPKPGEITLAHHGVLFLDELTEYEKSTLDLLRQPLESGEIQVDRLQGSCTYPADFLLICALNPCACGYFPDRNRCSCTEPMLRRYMNKISQPFLDRMDLCISVQRLTYRELTNSKEMGEKSVDIRQRVCQVHGIQKKRFLGTNIHYNGRIPGSMVEQYCTLGSEEQKYMEGIYKKYELTGRSYHKILKVARTIADMDGETDIAVKHLMEAVCYRSFDKTTYGITQSRLY